MTRTSRRLSRSLHTTASPSEERSRSRSSFRPSEASTHRFRPSFQRTLRLAYTSAASAAAAPKGSKHYSRLRAPTGLQPSTRRDTDGKERGEARLDTQLRGRAREAKR